MELLGYRKFESAEAGFDEEGGYLYLNYLKESSSEDFRAFWHYIFVLTEMYPHHKLLINQKKQNVFPADQKWLAQEWAVLGREKFPASEETPRYIALISAENFYIEYTTAEYVNSKNVGGSCIQMFTNKDEAKEWLLNK